MMDAFLLSQFFKPQIGQITQHQIIETQKNQNYPIFYLSSLI